MSFLDQIDPSWHPIFLPRHSEIGGILDSLSRFDIAPAPSQIFRAFSQPLPAIKVLILGQDPYPGAGVADGLAFSVSPTSTIPASLKNIFTEYSSDLGLPTPTSGDLTSWQSEGVMLLNTSLTTIAGERDSHSGIGWKPIISEVVELLSSQDICAILWGNRARTFGAKFKMKVESAHPSPLSAYRGFFNSRPFTRTNQLLRSCGRLPVDWTLP